ncbi:MAG: SNF2-related protein [Burkholderia gladioli]
MTERRAFAPRPYQGIIIDHILDTPRCAVWAGMGMGKTVSTLTAMDALELIDPSPTLSLAPLRVAQSTWPDEVQKWAHLRNVEVTPIVGTPAARRAAPRSRAHSAFRPASSR